MTSNRNLKIRILSAIRAVLALAVFSMLLFVATRPAQAQTETVLYTFTGGSDGGGPLPGLTSDGAGNFYATTKFGGDWGYGTVYELSPNRSGGWNQTVLYSFTGGADGGTPYFSNVIFDRVGNLYGTTFAGGAYGYGVVFELSPAGTSWTETVLYTFTGGADGANPENGLIMDAAGKLYGKTLNLGENDGVVFELSPSGGDWTERAIYTVPGASYAGLAMDAAGNIYGTTASTVFELSPNGTGGWNPAVIHTFAGAPTDGYIPEGTPVLDQDGNLYGTTYEGGATNYGTVYMLSPGGNGE